MKQAVVMVVWVACMALAACKPSSERADPQPEATAPADTPSATTDQAQAPTATAGPVRPGLQVKTIDGADYDLAEHRGKWVVVNFWATWCAPCRKEMPELSALDAMREHIEVIGLAYEEIEPAQMQAFLKQYPVVYPVAIIDVNAPPRDFDTPRGLPMTYLIAPDGKVAKTFLGPVTATEIEAAVASAGAGADAPSGAAP